MRLFATRCIRCCKIKIGRQIENYIHWFPNKKEFGRFNLQELREHCFHTLQSSYKTSSKLPYDLLQASPTPSSKRPRVK